MARHADIDDGANRGMLGDEDDQRQPRRVVDGPAALTNLDAGEAAAVHQARLRGVDDAGFQRDANGNRGDAQDLFIGGRMIAVDADVLDDEHALRPGRPPGTEPHKERQDQRERPALPHLSSFTRKRICTSPCR